MEQNNSDFAQNGFLHILSHAALIDSIERSKQTSVATNPETHDGSEGSSPSEDTVTPTKSVDAVNEETDDDVLSEMSYTWENPDARNVHEVDVDNTTVEATTDQNWAEWNPTEEELLAIAFGNEGNEADNRDPTPAEPTAHDGDEIDDAGQEPQQNLPAENDDSAETNNRNVDNDATAQEDNHRNDDDAEADLNPRPQNPWGMSDAELEQLRIDQDRIWGYVRDRDSAPKPFECACGESSMEPYGFVNLTCADNCVRCVDCLNSNVRVGLESRKNYPPACCIPIDFENVLDHLEPELIDRWLDVKVEFEDVAPVYCSVKECSLYLPKASFIEEGKWAVCERCDIRTCPACLCPESQHEADSNVCPERLDKMDKELITKQGWKACPRCKEMIERTEGCDHMICECGQEFCHGCGRSYQPPFPCNCHGQNQWAEQNQEEADPQRQQEILDQAGNGNHEEAEEDSEEDSEDDGEEEDGEDNLEVRQLRS